MRTPRGILAIQASASLADSASGAQLSANNDVANLAVATCISGVDGDLVARQLGHRELSDVYSVVAIGII